MSVHWLKTAPEFYEDAASGRKPFEVRIDDRLPRYEVDDELVLAEYSDGQYHGRECNKRVTYVLRDERFCLPGYCIMGIETMEPQREPKEQN